MICAYSKIGRDKECRYHFRRALELAQKYDMFYTFSSMQYYYIQKSFDEALCDFPLKFRNKIEENKRTLYKGYEKFTEALQINSIYKLIKQKDYIYLIFAAQGLTNKEVAERLHISLGTVGKHYGEIYAMLGVQNKAEAISLYRRLTSDPSII